TGPDATEAGDPAGFAVNRGSGATTTFARDVVVYYSGTATLGLDYSVDGPLVSGANGVFFTVQIPAGQMSATITVNPIVNADNLATLVTVETLVLTAEGT